MRPSRAACARRIRLKTSRALGAVIAASALSAACAQDSGFEQPPPAIDFPEWRLVSRDPVSTEYELEFPSAASSAHPANDIVPLRVLVPSHAEGPVPAVLILHYWGALDLRSERNLAVELNRRGLAGVLLTLPYHLRRAPAGTRSGALAIVPDPKSLIRTMDQSVLDVRRTVDWVQSRPEFAGTPIGITGTSLGALVASLSVGVEPRISKAAFLLGGADLAHILWTSSRVVREREELRRAGYNEAKLREALKRIEPLEHLKQRPPVRAFVIAARNDTVIPPSASRKLIAVLREPLVLWLDSGHYGGFLVQKQVQRSISDYFGAELKGGAYVPPKRIAAPILRVGLLADMDDGMQVIGGVDLWRDRAEGGVFAAFVAAPRGFQLFVGTQSRRGLSVGVNVGGEGVQPSLMWSMVL